jgi:hypothetical protein
VLDFEERQSFRQWWFLLLVVFVVIGSWAPAVAALIAGDTADPRWIGALVLVLAGILFPGWLLLLQLHVIVDAEGVRIRYRGLRVDRMISFTDVAALAAITYRPIRDYGGWGVRWRGKGRVAYSVSGDRGVQIGLADGTDVLIGSQRADELAAAISLRARLP